MDKGEIASKLLNVLIVILSFIVIAQIVYNNIIK
jgi:hypothetical protein